MTSTRVSVIATFNLFPLGGSSFKNLPRSLARQSGATGRKKTFVFSFLRVGGGT